MNPLLHAEMIIWSQAVQAEMSQSVQKFSLRGLLKYLQLIQRKSLIVELNLVCVIDDRADPWLKQSESSSAQEILDG